MKFSMNKRDTFRIIPSSSPKKHVIWDKKRTVMEMLQRRSIRNIQFAELQTIEKSPTSYHASSVF